MSSKIAINQKGTSSREPKLRNSCDACAAAKVKCSKDHPRCKRCSSGNLICVYGVSLKHGKPQRKKIQLEHPPKPQLQAKNSPEMPVTGASYYQPEIKQEDLYRDLQISFSNQNLGYECANNFENFDWYTSPSDVQTPLAVPPQPSTSATSMDSFFPPLEITTSQNSDTSSMPSMTYSSDNAFYSGQNTPETWGTPAPSATDLPTMWGKSPNIIPSPLPNQLHAGHPSPQQDQHAFPPSATQSCPRAMNGSQDCYATITHALGMLHAYPNPSYSSQLHHHHNNNNMTATSYTFSEIQKLTSQAIATLWSAHDCHCLAQNYIALIYGSAIVKTLSWIRVAASCPLSPSGTGQGQGWPAQASRGHSERRNALLGNLKKVAKVVAELARRVGGGAGDEVRAALVVGLKAEVGRCVRGVERG